MIDYDALNAIYRWLESSTNKVIRVQNLAKELEISSSRLSKTLKLLSTINVIRYGIKDEHNYHVIINKGNDMRHQFIVGGIGSEKTVESSLTRPCLECNGTMFRDGNIWICQKCGAEQR